MAATATPGQHFENPEVSQPATPQHTAVTAQDTRTPNAARFCITYCTDSETHPSNRAPNQARDATIDLPCLFDYNLREAIDLSACRAQQTQYKSTQQIVSRQMRSPTHCQSCPPSFSIQVKHE